MKQKLNCETFFSIVVLADFVNSNNIAREDIHMIHVDEDGATLLWWD